MQKKVYVFFILVFFVCVPYCIKAQINPPTLPTIPEVPSVPGADQNRRVNEFPSPPPLPSREQSGSVTVIDSYDLLILSAYPNGNTRNNVSNTINHASYKLYSNRNMEIKLIFNDGAEYIYHLRNPRTRVEISAGLFRETFDTSVQVGNQFLLGQYISELCYNENTITSFNLMQNNRVIVLINFRKAQS